MLVGCLSIGPSVAFAEPLGDVRAGQIGRVEFSSITPPNRWELVRKVMENTKTANVSGDLLMPQGVGGAKVPAVLISHDSGGVTPRR